MARAQPAVPGFFPLDDELGLLPGSLTPRLHETLVRLSITQPSFAKACAELDWHTSTTLHPDTARQRTEAAGSCLLKQTTADAQHILNQHPPSPPGPDTLIFSVDGAMVPLVGGHWKEVRTLAVGTVQSPTIGPDATTIHTTDLSYFSRLTDASSFGDLAVSELHRRGIERARRVGAVVDGAEWCQSFIDYHYPEAVRILDLPHACEHITTIGQAVGVEGPLLCAAQLEHLRDDLRTQGPDAVLTVLRDVVASQPSKPELTTALAYLEKRRAQMDYPQFVADGWPIGSGMVESANKLVVQQRLKGRGMQWQEVNVNPLLALRNAFCNQRWEESWSVIEQGLRQAVVSKRELRQVSTDAKTALSPASSAGEEVSIEASPASVEPQPKNSHPWRRAWSIRRQRELANAA